MSVIARKFTKDILLSTLFVLVVLIALFAFFELIGKMDEVGSNEYSLGTAFLLTALTIPSRTYEVAPLAVLLASVFTMSRWAATSEFTVLRASGLSPLRLAATLVLPGLLLVCFTFVMGEACAPWAQRYSTEIRTSGSVLSARGYSSGAWVRDTASGEAGDGIVRYINIRSISSTNRNETSSWRVFELSSEGRLMRMILAEKGNYRPDEGWMLSRVRIVTYPSTRGAATDRPPEGVSDRRLTTWRFSGTGLTPEILGVMTTKPDRMAMEDLSKYIAHLEREHQEADHFVAVFWSKALYPFGCFVMLVLSMPFAYMNARSGGVAVKVFLGVLIGIAFYALNNLFSYLSGFSSAPPWLMAAAPSLFMLGGTAVVLWWVEKR